MRFSWVIVLSFPLAAGCLPEEPPAVYAEAEETPPPAEPRVVSSVAMQPAVAGRVLAPRASDADRVRPAPVFFRLGAGYGAVGRVDLGPCRERGLDPGYVRMRVTFAGNGSVAHATVESPTPPPPDAIACISERLQAASVPSFEGGEVTLSKSVFVVEGRGGDVLVQGEPAQAVPPTASQ